MERWSWWISIPLWDYWNFSLNFLIIFLKSISIPLWDYWNSLKPCVKYYLFWISIPLWDYWNEESKMIPPPSGGISIPLWDYWNLDGKRIVIDIETFQSHSGTIGTHSKSIACFLETSFQSHSGTIGTRHIFKLLFPPIIISIPLWDYWNHTLQEQKRKSLKYFNPTLGLLEHLNLDLIPIRFSNFNPTLGLLERMYRTIYELVRKNFNPTLGLLELFSIALVM